MASGHTPVRRLFVLRMTDMSDYRIDPRKQFSKRLARWTAVFWFFYMSYLSTIMLLEPGTGMYVFYISIVVSVVMIVNVLAYTHNSVVEKIAFMMLDKTKIEIGGGKAKGDGTDDESGGGNG